MNKKLFGAYLLEMRAINPHQLEEAIRLQRQRRLLLGELGIQRGYFRPADVHRILRSQRDSDSDSRFGELAVQMNIINHQQLEELLRAQAENHYYLGEALLSLGHIGSKEELFQHLARFKTLSAPKSVTVDESLCPESNMDILQKLIELTFHFFYSEGYVIEMVGIQEESPPADGFTAYSVVHGIGRKALFGKKSSYVLSILLPDSWSRIIDGEEVNEGKAESFDNTAQMVFNFNDLFSRKLRALNYRCTYSAIRLSMPEVDKCLVVEFETPIERLYVLLAKIHDPTTLSGKPVMLKEGFIA